MFVWIVGIIAVLVGGVIFVIYRFTLAPQPSYRLPAKRLHPDEWSDDQVTVGWIGHSTVLINFYGYRVITDPVLGERVGITVGKGLQIGPKRYTGPAIDPTRIGSVDLILLSHAHFDHFDIPSLRQLANRRTHVITAKGTSHLLKKLTFASVTELGGDESLDLGEMKIRAVPVKHWGNRFHWNINYGVTGYLLERKNRRIFYAGDTALTSFAHLADVGLIDIVCMPIGAYAPDAFQRFHCTPEQAWTMFQQTAAKWLVPIHWNTFILTAEPFTEPMERLLRVAENQQEQIVIRQQGEEFTLVEKEEN